MNNFHCVRVILIVAALSVVVLPTVAADRPERAVILKTFAKVAVTAGSGPTWSRTRRWPDAIRIAIDGDYTTQDATKVAHTRDLIRRVIQRPMPIFFSPLSPAEISRTHVVVAFREPAMISTAKATLQRTFEREQSPTVYVDENDGCVLVLHPDGERQLAFAMVLVATGSDDAARHHCISLRLTQAMGLPGSYPEASGSVFDSSQRNKHTLLDRAILWLLYHPEMNAGLDREQALKRIKELLVREGLN